MCLEQNYCITEQELLGIILWVRKFQAYLAGAKFTVRMDHSTLRWLLNTKELEGQMGTYEFEILHRPSKKHCNVDDLSWGPCPRGRRTKQGTLHRWRH